MNYCFDLDGTICDTPSKDSKPLYHEANPIPFMVEQVNRLFDEGNKIIIMTARGRGSGKNWTNWTIKQLDMWGVKYHELEPMFHKPTADLFSISSSSISLIQLFFKIVSDVFFFNIQLSFIKFKKST